MMMNDENLFLKCVKKSDIHEDVNSIYIDDLSPPEDIPTNNVEVIQNELKDIIACFIDKILKFYGI